MSQIQVVMNQIHNEYFPIKSDLNPMGNHAPFWERILPNPSEESHVPLVAKTHKDTYKLKLPNNSVYHTTQKKKISVRHQRAQSLSYLTLQPHI